MEYIDMASLDEQPYSWLTIDSEKCDRCGICVDMCPMDVLHFGRSGHPYMRHRDDCWYCDICVFVCPQRAITMTSLPYLIR